MTPLAQPAETSEQRSALADVATSLAAYADEHRMFLLVNRIYEERTGPRLVRRAKARGRKPSRVATDNAWMRAAKIARRYVRLVAAQNGSTDHADAVRTAQADLERGAHDLMEAQR